MGLWSTIGTVVGTALGGPAGGTAGATIGGFLDGSGGSGGSTALDIAGSLYDRSQNRRDAATAFERSMYASNTSWQRGVADMRAAGLNPILAYSQGGASTPTAQAAASAPVGNVGSRAVQNAATLAGISNTQQSTRTSAAQERATLESAENTRLNNEGLRALPPQYRALATMGASTGAGVAAGAHALKTAAPMLKQGVKNLQGWGSFFKQKSHDVYRGFSKGKR